MSDGADALPVIDGRYRVIAELGRGAFAKAYRCEDHEGGGEVVVKLYELGDRAWSLVTSFEREAAVLAELSHPAIPRYLAHRQLPDGRLMLVQSYAAGTSLAELLRQNKRFTDDEVSDLTEQILTVLQYLHSLNPPIVHRDIKPANLVIGDSKRVQLVDFGSVKEAFRREPELGSTVVGTYGYMAPEQFQGRATVQSDLYALGATLVHVLSHIPPSDLPQDGLKLDFESSVKATRGTREWLGRMLEPDPKQRFESATEALEAFRKRHASSEPTATASSAPHALAKRGSTRLIKLDVTPPQGSRLRAKLEKGELRLVIPGSGFRGPALKLFGFATFWLVFVAFWTGGAAQGSLLFACFSIPFWLVGFWMMKQAVQGIFGKTELAIGPDAFELYERLWQFGRHYTGSTSDLEGVTLGASDVRVNSTRIQHCVLHAGSRDIPFGHHLALAERLWVASTINKLLGKDPDEPDTKDDADD